MTGSSGTGPDQTDHASGAGVHEAEEWARLQEGRDPESFSRAWLDRQAAIIGPDVVRAVVVLGAPETGPYAPVAVWPEGTLGSPWLVSGVENAISRKQTILERGKRSPTSDDQKRKLDVVSHPLMVDGQVCGAVSFETEHRSAEGTQAVADALRWGVVWLEALIRRNKYTSSDRLVTVIELIATSLHHDRFQASATAVATELAGILHCERVSIGFMRGQHSRVRALSHTASFGKKANVIRAIEAAMDEAIDQQATVLYPPAGDGPLQVTKAHEALSKDFGAGAICTVPMAEGQNILGAITL